ncbi:MinD/ParA family protein [Spirillospora sp. NPDC127200]
MRAGTGRSVTAMLLAGIIQQQRADRVLLVDAAPGTGSVPARLGVVPPRCLHDLATVRPHSWEEASGFLARSKNGVWVLSQTTIGAPLNYDTFQAAVGRLSRYVAVSVIDCPASPGSDLGNGVLASAHAQILVAADALALQEALAQLNANNRVSPLPRTVVALTAPSRGAATEIKQVQGLLAGTGIPFVRIPHDRHIAAGSTLDLDRAATATRAAASALAATAFDLSLMEKTP